MGAHLHVLLALSQAPRCWIWRRPFHAGHEAPARTPERVRVPNRMPTTSGGQHHQRSRELIPSEACRHGRVFSSRPSKDELRRIGIMGQGQHHHAPAGITSARPPCRHCHVFSSPPSTSESCRIGIWGGVTSPAPGGSSPASKACRRATCSVARQAISQLCCIGIEGRWSASPALPGPSPPESCAGKARA